MDKGRTLRWEKKRDVNGPKSDNLIWSLEIHKFSKLNTKDFIGLDFIITLIIPKIR